MEKGTAHCSSNVRTRAKCAAHLIVHGLLHLAGYEHEVNDTRVRAMEALETKALASLGIADPYCDAA